MSTLTEGSVVAGCRIDSVVGRGGMGIVYGATQLALSRPVAVKVIAPEFAEDPEFRERFQDEWRAAGGLDHPCVVPVYQAGEEGGLLFVVMRYVEGTDLRAVMDREGALAPERAVGIVGQIAGALDDAHRHGLIHRDVKPANILITPQPQGRDRAFLTDFGLTRHATSAAARRTNTGQWVGTPDYIAPEQIEGTTIDGRADVYALGCVLYEALTGSLPFPQAELVAKVMARLQGPVPLPSARRPELAPFDPVIERALARRPDERYPTAGDLAREAGRAAGQVGPRTFAAAAAGAAGAGVGSTRIDQAPSPPPTAPAWAAATAAPPHSPQGGYTPPLPSPQGGYAPPPTRGHPPSPSPPGGYGPPARKRSRLPLIAGLTTLAVLLVGGGVAVALLSGGGSDTPRLDRLRVQTEVEAFTKKTVTLDGMPKATCPADVQRAQGRNFNCIVRGDKDVATVRVIQRDDRGTTSERLTKGVYASDYIENAIRTFYRKKRDSGDLNYAVKTVTCPPTFNSRAGVNINCPATFTDDVTAVFPVRIYGVTGSYKVNYRNANGSLR